MAKHELSTVENAAMTKAGHSPAAGAMEMMDRLIEKGVTPETVAVLKELRLMHIDDQERNAKAAFATAFREMQSELPAIAPMTEVPNKDGSLRYKFASYDQLKKIVGPIMQKHGFAVSFSTKLEGNRVVSICTLTHDAGFSRSNEYYCRIGSGPPGSSESQADGAANSYAQRGALCDALDIVIQGRDNDARDLGAPVTFAQSESLRQRVYETKSDERAFLKFAGAQTFETIPSTRYAELDAFLKRKEGRA